MHTVYLLYDKWLNSEHERFGQWFMNRYTKGNADENDPRLKGLYYKTDIREQVEMIKTWLDEHGYSKTPPTPLKEI